MEFEHETSPRPLHPSPNLPHPLLADRDIRLDNLMAAKNQVYLIDWCVWSSPRFIAWRAHTCT